MLLSVIFWRIEPISIPDSYESLTFHHTHLFRENLAHKLGDDVHEFGIKFLLKIPGSARVSLGSSTAHPLLRNAPISYRIYIIFILLAMDLKLFISLRCTSFFIIRLMADYA